MGSLGCPSPPFGDPLRDQFRISACGTAQSRRLPSARFIRLALQDARHVRQQVRTIARELAKRSHRCSFFVFGKLTPLRLVPRLAVKLRGENPVSLRSIIEHAF